MRLGFEMGRCYMRMDFYEIRDLSNKVRLDGWTWEDAGYE